MATSLDNSQLNNMVRDIATIELGNTVGRRIAVNEAVTYMWDSGALGAWARAYSRIPSQSNVNDNVDMVNVIAESVLKHLSTVTVANIASTHDWAGVLSTVAKRGVRDYLTSGQVTPASGMGGTARRQYSRNRAASELLGILHREPTRTEVIAHVNSHMLATRKDAKKQGALLTERDFEPTGSASLSVDGASEIYGLVQPDAYLSLENRMRAGVAIQRIQSICLSLYPDDENMGPVVLAWVTLAAQDDSVTPLGIANETGLSRRVATDCLVQLHAALAVLREEER